MGQYAEDIIDGLCDWQGDYTAKYNIKNYEKNTRLSDAEKKIKSVRKELAILIKKKLAAGEHQAVNNARKEINIKYGHGWRERGLISNSPDQWLPLDQYPINSTNLNS